MRQAPVQAAAGPAPPRDAPPARAKLYRYVCADTLELLWVVLHAERAALWAHAEAPRLVFAVGRDACMLPGAGSTACPRTWPSQPAYSPESRTLLLPCADGSGQAVALAQVTGVRATRLPSSTALTAVGAVLARTVSEAAGGAGAGPAEKGHA